MPARHRLLLGRHGRGEDLVVLLHVEVVALAALHGDAIEPLDPAGASNAGDDDTDGEPVVDGEGLAV